jgi:hypothetical protein
MINHKYFATVLLAGAIGLCSGCAGNAQQDQVQGETQQKTPLTVDEILQRDPTQEDYIDTPRCIRARQIRDLDVIDDQHIVFEVARNEYYLVRFERRCPGLRRGSPVIYEPGGSGQLCVLDGIRATYDNGLGNITPGMRCAIPKFESVSKEQVVLLKDALKVERRKPDPAPEPVDPA